MYELFTLEDPSHAFSFQELDAPAFLEEYFYTALPDSHYAEQIVQNPYQFSGICKKGGMEILRYGFWTICSAMPQNMLPPERKSLCLPRLPLTLLLSGSP